MSTVGPVLTLLVLLAGIGAVLLCVWSLRIARGAEKLVPPTGRMVDVPGGTLHVVEAGDASAPPVVLIHGLSGQLQHFTYALTDRLAPDHRVIAIDRPGCGHSTRASDDLASLPEQARMLWAALDTIGVERPVLVGHSLGGAVVLAMALARPDGAGALVLLTPYTHPVSSPNPIFAGLHVRSPLLRRLLGYTLAVPLARQKAQETLETVFAPEPWPQDFVIRGGGALGLRPKGYVTAAADLTAIEDEIAAQAARYGEIRVPGQVLLASGDTLLPVAEQGAPLAEHGFEVHTLEDRGHMIPLTAPDDCAEVINKAVAQASRA